MHVHQRVTNVTTVTGIFAPKLRERIFPKKIRHILSECFGRGDGESVYLYTRHSDVSLVGRNRMATCSAAPKRNTAEVRVTPAVPMKL